jgi:STE24 endopeptidase
MFDPGTETLVPRLAFQILMVLIYPTVIQPLFNKLTPLPEGDLRKRIESLASKLSFPLKHLYEIDGSKRSSHSNAYFFGLPWVMRFFPSFGKLTMLL